MQLLNVSQKVQTVFLLSLYKGLKTPRKCQMKV